MKVFLITCCLECPSDWDLESVRRFLRRQLLTTEAEAISLIVTEGTSYNNLMPPTPPTPKKKKNAEQISAARSRAGRASKAKQGDTFRIPPKSDLVTATNEKPRRKP